MDSLTDIGTITHDILKEHFSLQPARLKRPFPLRPIRMLGMLRFDGHAYCSDLFLRALIMKSSFLGRGGCSIFLCPRPEYHLPIFTTEAFFLGKKIVFLVDVQQAFVGGSHDNAVFFEGLRAIRSRYPELLVNPRIPKGKIAELFSPASCYVTLVNEQADRGLDMYREYLDAYSSLVSPAQPVAEDRRETARKDFETYVDVMINHDPAMKNAYLCFGKEGGRRWALNLFYDR